MSEAVLNALERDVEQARAKFAGDLARLRSPANLARFKNNLWADAREVKDEVIDKAKEAAQDGAQRLLAELKARVAANPLATMAIGVRISSPPRNVGSFPRLVSKYLSSNVSRLSDGDREKTS
jgi:hypothetical protein